MTDKDKHKIAASFPDKYDTDQLGLEISATEFKVFEDGVFANSMDEKWNVFVLKDILYFARSWTGFCIYRVYVRRQAATVILSHFNVNRDDSQYKSEDVDSDTILLKELLQMFLDREDFYSDPQLEFPLIKATIESLDPSNQCKKSISPNSVGLVRQIHDILTGEGQREFYDVMGWIDLKQRIVDKADDEPLISLYLQNRKTHAAATYYFDKDASELLGQIVINARLRNFC